MYGLKVLMLFVISGRTTGKSFQGVRWGHPSDDNYTLRTLHCFVFTFGWDKIYYVFCVFAILYLQLEIHLNFLYILKPSIFYGIEVNIVFVTQM